MFKSFEKQVLTAKNLAIDRALHAMGQKAVAGVQKRMEKGYFPTKKKDGTVSPAIRETSALIGSIQYETYPQEKSVVIGTNIEYATQIHEGTRKIKGRPYLKDGIDENMDKIKKVCEAEVKRTIT